MSQRPISRSSDLLRLRNEGFDLEVKAGHLVVHDVPYVNSKGEIHLGKLVSKLDLAGDVAQKPGTHVAMWAGDYPCDKRGAPIKGLQHGSKRQTLADGLTVDHSFSSKPVGRGKYDDYYEKMTTYVAIISSPAEALDESATARTFPIVRSGEEDDVFKYVDTASSRAEIAVVTDKLRLHRIAIVGVGGTGAYVLDLVAKVPVREIHLFDGDAFLQHNAFRAPGAASLEVLEQKPSKVDYLKTQYANMRHGIIGHECYIDSSNVDQLHSMDFVFLCLDKGEAKDPIVRELQDKAIPFVDVGMGLSMVNDALLGVVRVTASTKEKSDHVRSKNRIPFTDIGATNEYQNNIQIADLNALNAALAVIKFKKVFGFYADFEREHFSTYTIDGNHLLNEDQHADDEAET